MTTLEKWREIFNDLDQCPWPGPRPLNETESDRLVGRDDDLTAVSGHVLDHSVLVLTGESGVGKSSFLNAKLRAFLKEEGFTAFVCDQWNTADGASNDPQAFIASVLPEHLGLLPVESAPLAAQLEERFGHGGVLILDQFEELIRYHPRMFRETLDWLIGVSYEHTIHIVLSLRAEFGHRLRRLEAGARPFSMASFVLEPLEGLDVVHDVILSANADGKEAIDGDAAKKLQRLWFSPDTAGPLTQGALGLLHLQGALYSLFGEACTGTIRETHVDSLIDKADGPFFDFALRRAVRLKLDHCVEACRELGIDPALVQGTRSVVERIAPNLSSGGLKLVREEWDLARHALQRELERFGRASGDTLIQAETALRALSNPTTAGGRRPGETATPDVLDLPRYLVLEKMGFEWVSDRERELELGFGLDHTPWISDPEDGTSGPMLGMPPHFVLVEELRRFVFAVQWLLAASLIRVTSVSADARMVSLIHDGFGFALEEWRTSTQKISPAAAVHLLTAAYGEDLEWPGIAAEFNGRETTRLIVNVRWRDCVVSTDFSRLVFVNCDFRGTRFERCRFEGVVFLNCLLDGASFGDCTIVGAPSEPTPRSEEDARQRWEDHADEDYMPPFTITAAQVPAAEKASNTIARYRTVSRSADLHSISSGLPSLPLSSIHEEGLPWTPEWGGLTMYGGRLTSLMIRDAKFPDGGTISLRHIAGSSLDVVEQTHPARITIFDSAIRGLTITRPPRSPSASERYGRVEIKLKSSVVAQSWFGDRLVGTASFQECKVWHLWQMGDVADFVVTLDNCVYRGLFNVEKSNIVGQRIKDFQDLAPDDRMDMVRRALRMDYRDHPARHELDRRQPPRS